MVCDYRHLQCFNGLNQREVGGSAVQNGDVRPTSDERSRESALRAAHAVAEKHVAGDNEILLALSLHHIHDAAQTVSRRQDASGNERRMKSSLNGRVSECEYFSALQQHIRIRDGFNAERNAKVVNLLIDALPAHYIGIWSDTRCANRALPDTPSTLPGAACDTRSSRLCDPRVRASKTRPLRARFCSVSGSPQFDPRRPEHLVVRMNSGKNRRRLPICARYPRE